MIVQSYLEEKSKAIFVPVDSPTVIAKIKIRLSF